MKVKVTEYIEVRRFNQSQYEEDRFHGKVFKRFSPKGNVIPTGRTTELTPGNYTVLESRRWLEPNGIEVQMIRFSSGWWVRLVDSDVLQTPVDELFVSDNCQRVSELLQLGEPPPPKDPSRW